jgi:hypothetical protein
VHKDVHKSLDIPLHFAVLGDIDPPHDLLLAEVMEEHAEKGAGSESRRELSEHALGLEGLEKACHEFACLVDELKIDLADFFWIQIELRLDNLDQGFPFLEAQ